MDIVCLDLEGTLVPEIWIAFAEKTGIPELRITTREEPDYNKLMKYRMDILRERGLTLKDIQDVIATIKPMEGAKEFLDKVREITQVVILSDTFKEFAKPLMKQLGWPTILCNSLVIDDKNMLAGMTLRQPDGKRKAIEAFRSINYRTFAAGDSYNDLSMIRKADAGCLFRAPAKILEEEPDLKLCTTYDEFFEQIKAFVDKG
ncbi:MAG: bifunctional phosphoserine phosphatase/homoserine phosphotransferase ThrH [Sphaerochaetaceae bacterium]|nr:bifunctional phosphoserine phosphatase/homoserine phosphotransferase ThrH [Sphaerochaetaceae bacterium]